jgi:hypothetical protein
MATMSSGDGSVGNDVFSVAEALKDRERIYLLQRRMLKLRGA